MLNVLPKILELAFMSLLLLVVFEVIYYVLTYKTKEYWPKADNVRTVSVFIVIVLAMALGYSGGK